MTVLMEQQSTELTHVCYIKQNVNNSKKLLLLFLSSDGNFLAIGSHDSYIYIYAVSENGRKYSRVGKCSVSTCIYV